MFIGDNNPIFTYIKTYQIRAKVDVRVHAYVCVEIWEFHRNLYLLENLEIFAIVCAVCIGFMNT